MDLMRLLFLTLALSMGMHLVVAQCADASACNYNADNTESGSTSACVTLETHAVHESGALAGMTTYRAYINLPESNQFLSAISTILTGCTDNSACN